MKAKIIEILSDCLILVGCGVLVYATSLVSKTAMWFVIAFLALGLGIITGLPGRMAK